MVTAFFNRLGNVGVLLIACALLLGGLAGAAVAHHYERLSADSISSHEADSGKDKGGQKQKHQHGNQKHPNKGHQGESGTEAPETD
jgi:hypothetical protein